MQYAICSRDRPTATETNHQIVAYMLSDLLPLLLKNMQALDACSLHGEGGCSPENMLHYHYREHMDELTPARLSLTTAIQQ